MREGLSESPHRRGFAAGVKLIVLTPNFRQEYSRYGIYRRCLPLYKPRINEANQCRMSKHGGAGRADHGGPVDRASVVDRDPRPRILFSESSPLVSKYPTESGPTLPASGRLML